MDGRSRYEETRGSGAAVAPEVVGVVGVLLAAGVPGAVGRPLAVVHDQAVIGRDDDCDVFLESARVSRRHARVWGAGGRFGVEDLGSLNGTYVNRSRVVGTRELRDGDRLTVADVELHFRALPAGSLPGLPRQARPAESRHPRGATVPMPPSFTVPYLASAERQAATDGPAGFSGTLTASRLGLSLAACLAGAAAAQAYGAGRWGAWAFALAAPFVVNLVVPGRHGRVRTASLVALTLISLVLTVAAVTAAELRFRHPVLPWVASGGTFASAVELDAVRGLAPLAPGCGESPAVAAAPDPAATKAVVRISGRCFHPGEAVDVRQGTTVLATMVADEKGALAGRVNVAPGASCARVPCDLVVQGTQSSRWSQAAYRLTSAR